MESSQQKWYDNEEQSPSRIISKSTHMATEILGKNLVRTSGPKQRQIGEKWSPPMTRSLKMNVDAGVFQDGTVGLRFIVRNEVGHLVLAGARRCNTSAESSTLIEALALWFSILEAVSKGMQILALEIDSQILARALQGTTLVDASSAMIVEDILEGADTLVARDFLFVGRDANRVAHFLAHFCQVNGCTHLWTNEVPSYVTVSW
ncbi:hypothetical protein ACS0TY_004016 [Phlomoides rotata]